MFGLFATSARVFQCAPVFLCIVFLSAGPLRSQTGNTVDDARRAFLSPPDDARILMRWWWFGPAVVDSELDREMQQMKAGGIGGFEIQPVYPLELNDPQTGFQNLLYLSQPFLDAVHYANERAHDLGLRVDLTLASGWPYGGPHTPVTQAAGALRLVRWPVPAESVFAPLPALANGESLVTAFLFNASETADPSHGQQLPMPDAGALRIPLPDPASSSREVWFFVSSRTGQTVKRVAVGAEGFVLDHFDRSAIDAHLHDVGDPLMTAFGDKPPYSVFSDSLEVYGSDWTPSLLHEFKQRRGYDLLPHLPQLFAGDSDEARSVRHDWGETLTELVNENYLSPITAWAHKHHTSFRSQSYGEPAVDLSSNALVDLPEGEGPQWRSFSYTRWATSAGHLYGRGVISAEVWTWLHSPAFRATPLDMKAEGDLFFLEGVNQFVGHGWPYTPPQVGEPGWAFYAAAVFNDHNPWWIVMPDVTGYFQRVSALLRQGQPANDVAVYIPTDDCWADFKPGHVAITDYAKNYITPALTASILDAGYNLDYIDAAAIQADKLQSSVLLLPHVERISPATYRKISEYAARGGKVIAVGRLPKHGPGLVEWQKCAPEISAISRALFAPSASSVEVKEESALGDALHKALAPDVRFASPEPELGFLHRKLADGDLYFIVNTSNHPIATEAQFRPQRLTAEVWDPVHETRHSVAPGQIPLNLQPYESVAVVLEGGRTAPEIADFREDRALARDATIDLSTGWIATVQRSGEPEKVNLPHLWGHDPAMQYYSGVVTYMREVEIPALKLSSSWSIDFGPGTPLEAAPNPRGTHALLDSPVREVAVVYVNGKRAGSIWCPPYRVDVTSLLHTGANQIEIRVANTAINTLAGRSLPDYRLLNLRYGERFQPQDMEHLQPLPSGIAGEVKLIEDSEPRP